MIEDTWHVSGLRGTGSHHFRVDGVVVPPSGRSSPLDDAPCIDEPDRPHPAAVAVLACCLASVAVGIAQGALDDIVALATDKVPLLAGAPLATNPTFQFDLATADAELRAARALLYETPRSVWAAASTAPSRRWPRSARRRGSRRCGRRTRAAASSTPPTARAAAARCTPSCPLQRRLRDVHAVTQHFLVRPDTMTTAGAILAGNDVDVLVF